MSLLVSTCRRLTLLNKPLLGPSVLSTQIVPRQNISKKYQSKKWPGYHVIYNLENVKTVSIINRMKLQTTVISSIAIPGVTALEVMNILTSSFVHNTVFVFGAIAVFFHGLGYFCNNVIGIVYAKKESDELKISYVGYFGRRRDIDTHFDHVCSPPQQGFLKDPLFHPIIVDSEGKTKKLRLFVDGKIIDEKKFCKLLGTDF